MVLALRAAVALVLAASPARGAGRVHLYAGRWSAPPVRVPTPRVPDGPILGNGDMGVVMGGDTSRLQWSRSALLSQAPPPRPPPYPLDLGPPNAPKRRYVDKNDLYDFTALHHTWPLRVPVGSVYLDLPWGSSTEYNLTQALPRGPCLCHMYAAPSRRTRGHRSSRRAGWRRGPPAAASRSLSTLLLRPRPTTWCPPHSPSPRRVLAAAPRHPPVGHHQGCKS